MEFIESIVAAFNGVLWGWPMLILLVGTGVFFTFATKFVQIRKFGAGMKKVFGGIKFKGGKQEGGLSSFQALTTAIAAQVGTGNIAGASTAIATGGPGAIFWMWIAAFFGMATIYSEATLAQHTRKVREDGTVIGGPVYYIKHVFKGKFGTFLATFFSLFTIIALGFFGNMVQSNSIADSFNVAFGAPKIAVGLVCAVIAGLIFIGGIQRIASVTEKVVPIMATLYVVGSIVILCMCGGEAVLNAFKSIFVMAFSPEAMGGGVLGLTVQKAMRYGFARGLFSNEAGMGSTPHAHATAKVPNPSDQGIVAMIGVFIDTFIVLTMTALVVVATGMWNSGETGSALAQAAYSAHFGNLGSMFIAICMLFFAFTTIIGWYYFGEVNVRYLFGDKAIKVYSVIVILFVIAGSVLKVSLVWDMADMFNGLMVIPNLIALLAGSAIVVKLTKDYDTKTKLEAHKE